MNSRLGITYPDSEEVTLGERAAIIRWAIGVHKARCAYWAGEQRSKTKDMLFKTVAQRADIDFCLVEDRSNNV